MSILSSMEFVWFSLILEGELVPPFGFLSPIIAETSGEKNPPMGSIPKTSRWPVSLIVRPVFLDFRNLSVSYCSNFTDSELIGNKGNKERQNKDATETHRPATPISVRKLFSRAFGGGAIIIAGEDWLND